MVDVWSMYGRWRHRVQRKAAAPEKQSVRGKAKQVPRGAGDGAAVSVFARWGQWDAKRTQAAHGAHTGGARGAHGAHTGWHTGRTWGGT